MHQTLFKTVAEELNIVLDASASKQLLLFFLPFSALLAIAMSVFAVIRTRIDNKACYLVLPSLGTKLFAACVLIIDSILLEGGPFLFIKQLLLLRFL